MGTKKAVKKNNLLTEKGQAAQRAAAKKPAKKVVCPDCGSPMRGLGTTKGVATELWPWPIQRFSVDDVLRLIQHRLITKEAGCVLLGIDYSFREVVYNDSDNKGNTETKSSEGTTDKSAEDIADTDAAEGTIQG